MVWSISMNECCSILKHQQFSFPVLPSKSRVLFWKGASDFCLEPKQEQLGSWGRKGIPKKDTGERSLIGTWHDEIVKEQTRKIRFLEDDGDVQ